MLSNRIPSLKQGESIIIVVSGKKLLVTKLFFKQLFKLRLIVIMIMNNKEPLDLLLNLNQWISYH